VSTFPRPKIVTVGVASSGAPTAGTTPNVMYSRIAADRAIRVMGRDAYAIVRTKAILAPVRQMDSLRAVLRPVEDALTELDALPATARPEEWNRLNLAVTFAGHEAHWQAIVRIGTGVEALVAMILAVEAYRRADGSDCAQPLLRHDLDLLGVLQAKQRRKPSYWEALSGRPTASQLAVAGMSPEDARLILDANRSWAIERMRDFQAIAAYYTPALHAVYTKYKHGYTLVSQMTSPFFMNDEVAKTRAAAEALAAGGFAVMHENAAGKRQIHVVRSNEAEIRDAVSTASKALDVTHQLAVMWLLQAEHPDHRSFALTAPNNAVFARWVGDGLDEPYSFSRELFSLVAAEAPDAH
jgi:hypothetical protein